MYVRRHPKWRPRPKIKLGSKKFGANFRLLLLFIEVVEQKKVCFANLSNV